MVLSFPRNRRPVGGVSAGGVDERLQSFDQLGEKSIFKSCVMVIILDRSRIGICQELRSPRRH